MFIGRWAPFHKGHKHIIRIIHKEKQLPILICIRDTVEQNYSLEQRVKIIETWLQESNIPGQVMVIPDIEGLYYGRGVGYEIREVVVDDATKQVSGTKIRQAIENGNMSEIYESVLEESKIDDEESIRERLRKLGYIE